MLGGFGLLSLKPMLRAINAGDDADEADFADLLDDRTFLLRGRLEAEIAQMAPEDATEFLAEFGIAEPGLSRAIRCLLYTSPSPRDRTRSRMPSSA